LWVCMEIRVDNWDTLKTFNIYALLNWNMNTVHSSVELDIYLYFTWYCQQECS
jgi:hypothetical protein